jgi:hypothetical protein
MSRPNNITPPVSVSLSAKLPAMAAVRAARGELSGNEQAIINPIPPREEKRFRSTDKKAKSEVCLIRGSNP